MSTPSTEREPAGPSLTVIVPATDRPAALARCTEAIEAAEDAPDEVVVVVEPAGLGPAGARNRGAALTESEILVFVDSDVEVHPDAFGRVRASFRSDPELVALFGSYDDDPAAPGVVSTFRNLLHHHVHQGSPGRATTFWAGLGAVRRDAFLAMGGFDADRFTVPSIEDIELGLRISRAGGKIVLDPELQGKHLKAWSLRDMVRTDFSRRGVPWVRLLLQQPRDSATTALNLGWRHRLGAAMSVLALVALLGRRPKVAAAAVASVVALDPSLYALLGRRGAAVAIAGPGLHLVHHLTAAGALGTGIVIHLAESARGPAPRSTAEAASQLPARV